LQKIFINYLFLASRAMAASKILRSFKWTNGGRETSSFLENPIGAIIHPYCVLDRSKAEQLVLYSAWLFLPALFVFTFFGMVFKRKVAQHWGSPQVNLRLFVLRTLLPTLVVQSFIFHPIITSTFIKFAVRCKRMDVSVMWVNPYIKCGEREQMQLFRTGLAGIFVYSVGIPVAFWVLLHRYRNKLMRHDVRIALGFLYDGYAHRYYFSECIIMLRKVIIDFLANYEGADATTPAERTTQVLMRFVLVGFCSLSIMFWAHPYETRQFQIFDKLEYASIVIFTCTSALDLVVQLESPDGEAEESLGVFIALIIMSMHFYILLLFVWALARNWLVPKVRSRSEFWCTPHHHPQKCHERALSIGGLQIGVDGKLDVSALRNFELKAMHRVLVDVTRCLLQDAGLFQVQHISDFVQTAFSSVIRRRLSASIACKKPSHRGSIVQVAESRLFEYVSEKLHSLSHVEPNSDEDDNATSVTMQEYLTRCKTALSHEEEAVQSMNQFITVEELHDEVLQVVDLVEAGMITFGKDSDPNDEESWGLAVLLKDAEVVQSDGGRSDGGSRDGCTNDEIMSDEDGRTDTCDSEGFPEPPMPGPIGMSHSKSFAT